MMNIQAKQAEKVWSLYQYVFLKGIRKTVPPACRSQNGT